MSTSPLFKTTEKGAEKTYTVDQAIDLLKKTFDSFPWGYRQEFCEKNNINYNTLNGILSYKHTESKKSKISSNKVVEIFNALGYQCEKIVEVKFQINSQNS